MHANFFNSSSRAWLNSVMGAVLAALCGLLLWGTSLGDPWINASYDYLFRFGEPFVTNNLVLIQMDSRAFDEFHQIRGQPWNRALHARLLDKLADDGCRLVVFDSYFGEKRDPAADAALARAMRRQRNVVLMAEQAQIVHPGLDGVQPMLPAEPFLSAAHEHWGVACLDPDLDLIVRRHWPFLSPAAYPSLPWTAALLSGAQLNAEPQARWLRYYGPDGNWPRLSYGFALTAPPGYFRDKVVFIGTQPQTSLPNGEPDKFMTPFTRWTGESVGGVEILMTSYLNLLNHDWLQRPAAAVEFVLLLATGLLLGGSLCRIAPPVTFLVAAAVAILISLLAILEGYFTNYWFPWLIVGGGQLPCALGWAIAVRFRSARVAPATPAEIIPATPGYKLIHPPFAGGAYGKVWLARNRRGQWFALKAVYLSRFGSDHSPYDREFEGISRYQPVSNRHPGLIRVDFISEKLDGYFYYVMELGDSLAADWKKTPSRYQPRDLAGERLGAPDQRLPLPECVRIGIALAEALQFLHECGLTHRDIKPQNVIFVTGQPKLADPGLVAEIRPDEEIKTYIGTPSYMPPPPEPPGTPLADIYALGILLYVISTGRGASFFPELATTLLANTGTTAGFLSLNAVILKACHPNPTKRYASAAEMGEALRQLA